ncbi:MAG: hypothetical protein ACRD2N_04490 [Vicinamibacterales bacterium]
MALIERVAFIAMLTISASGCLGSSAGRPQVTGSNQQATSAPLQQLRGEWTLVSLDAQGPRRASGRLTLDEFNNIVIRAELAPGEAGATPPRVVLLDFTAKASTPAQGELNYLGLETRSPQDVMVTLGGGPGAWRHFSINGDTLLLWQEDGRGQRVGTMTFTRVR